MQHKFFITALQLDCRFVMILVISIEWEFKMDITTLQTTISPYFEGECIRKISFSASKDKMVLRAEALPFKQGQTTLWRITKFLSDGKAIHENFKTIEMPGKTIEMLEVFSEFHLHGVQGQFDCRVSKKGKILICNKLKQAEKASIPEHDRNKQYILDSYKCRDFLHALGVSDENGNVFEKKMAKFRQINKFLEIVRDVYKELPATNELVICDLCCGKSYLTFAVYYYLTVEMNRKVKIYGVDRKLDVISYCDSLAKKLNFDGMEFVAGDILNFNMPQKPDMVISLHACDIATDIVLAGACRFGAKIILATPCCHHEMFSQSTKNKPSELDFIMEHSILRQKFCTAATDALRALRLEAEGYKVDAFELIDPEETPKNVILKAVYKNTHGIQRDKALLKYRNTCEFLGVSLTLDKLLSDAEREANSGNILTFR